MRRYAPVLMATVLLTLFFSGMAFAQNGIPASEVKALKGEIQQLQERLNRLEQMGTVKPLQAPVVPPAPPLFAARPGEREISVEKEHPLETIGLAKPELMGTKISGFFVGSFNYNSHVQMVPEFAGGGQALSDPQETNFRFDKFGLQLSRTFAPWLFASAAIEIERHRDRHSHGFDPAFACPGSGLCIERFGSEEAETEAELDRFELTVVAPLGNGVPLSIGRFDVPFGIERHDEPLNLTATTSEVAQFGRPELMTGFRPRYQFNPWVDVTAWVVNRWESDTTDDPFDDNNRDKSFGGRLGFTPFPREGLLNVGLGGWWGPERDDHDADARWLLDVDFTWTPMSRLLLAGEVIYGGEGNVSFRERGLPFPQSAVENKDVNWWGFYALAHYDLRKWLGISFRYGYFDDEDGWRTGVEQVLQSWTFAPVIHLSRLIPNLRPSGATYARTQHPIDWVNVKLEYRLNHSDEDVFSDAGPAHPIPEASETSHQIQLQLNVIF